MSVGHDPALAGAAGAGARIYRSVAHPDELSDLDHAAGTVTLIVLPWPPPKQPDGMSRDALVAMFSACRQLMSPGGCTIVALAGLPPQQTFAEHSSTLIPAAHEAGLGWLQHIVAITAPIAGHRITWQAVPADPATLRAATHLKVHLDLFLFVDRQFAAHPKKLRDSQRHPGRARSSRSRGRGSEASLNPAHAAGPTPMTGTAESDLGPVAAENPRNVAHD